MKFTVLIPARYGSQRLPGKPLADINGKPMIEHVWLQATAAGAERVVVCTDDERIAAVVNGFGGEALMTSAQHQSGTDRISEATETLRLIDDAIVVNLQGDEPMMPPGLIRQAAETLHHAPQAQIATLAVPVASLKDYLNPNVVKVVVDQSGRALYFSRAPIPWQRDSASGDLSSQTRHDEALRHLGIYAYRVDALRVLSRLPAVAIEQAEKLEQLRALWTGMHIQVAIANEVAGHGIDTQEDLEVLRETGLSR